MNCCTNNGYLWILIIMLIMGTNGNVFSSGIFSGCGWPVLLALVFCMCKNGTLSSLFQNCGCNCNCGC